MLPSLKPVDFVVRALPSAYGASFAQLRDDCLRVREHLANESNR
jgi:hypothetical protein